ncbi:MAG: hypothetical protein JOZ49_22590 [Mycolicibacterium sp.]|nr:hypothetical protein [Mycolicibacterium sp.]
MTSPRALTLEIAYRLNLLISGLQSVRNQILIGVDANGNEPVPGHPRLDTTAHTTRTALEDLITLRDITSTTIHAVAAAAIAAGIDRYTATTWAHYDADDQALNEGIDTILSRRAKDEPGR